MPLFLFPIAQQGTASSSRTTSGIPAIPSLSPPPPPPPPPPPMPHSTTFLESPSSPRPVVYQSPPVPPRRSPPDHLVGLNDTTSSLTVSGDQSSPSTLCSEPSRIPPASPTALPRSPPSKIPTPMPRKLLTSPVNKPRQSLATPSPLLPASHPDEIVPVVESVGPPVMVDEPAVVEVCEKVLVPRGQALVMPYITVERCFYADVADEEIALDNTTEVRVVDDEQQCTASSSPSSLPSF